MNWQPQDWLSVGAAGPEQQSPDLSDIIQEIVSRNGYTANSSIAIIIDGTGTRTAESFNGSIHNAPELCVEFLTAIPDNRIASSTFTSIAEGTREEQNTPSLHIDTEGENLFAGGPVSPIRVHPNPATNKLNVSFSSKIEGIVQIQARDLNGKTVLKATREVAQGDNIITLQGLSLPDGIYFLQLFTNNTIQSAKFIIQTD